MNVTIPVGVAEAVTVAVNVTGEPTAAGFADEVNCVVVAAGGMTKSDTLSIGALNAMLSAVKLTFASCEIAAVVWPELVAASCHSCADSPWAKLLRFSVIGVVAPGLDVL